MRLSSRNGRDWSFEFSAIAHALRQLPGDVVLDGEAVAHCEQGLPDFGALFGRHSRARAILFAFDFLMVDEPGFVM